MLGERNIKLEGGSGLFHYAVLNCFANFKTSHRRFSCVNYTIYPGEWLCTIDELISLLRVRNRNQALEILYDLQERNLISFNLLSAGDCVKYRIKGWSVFNRTYDYHAPCHKDTGFFYIPISLTNEIVGTRTASEADILLDLWINAIYYDDRVTNSSIGPVVYYRNGTGNPTVSYEFLARRWNTTKRATVKYLKKLKSLGYVTITGIPGVNGVVIHLQKYLSTIYRISDVLLDKEEIAMLVNVKLDLDESILYGDFGVSKSHTEFVMKRIEKVLSAQGFPCLSCSKLEYRLLRLSDTKEKSVLPCTAPPQQRPCYRLIFYCGGDIRVATFELTLRNSIQRKGGEKK